MSEEIKLEVGKTYVTRDGKHKVTIAAIDERCKWAATGVLLNSWYEWDIQGKLNSLTRMDHDLVWEYKPPREFWVIDFGGQAYPVAYTSAEIAGRMADYTHKIIHVREVTDEAP